MDGDEKGVLKIRGKGERREGRGIYNKNAPSLVRSCDREV